MKIVISGVNLVQGGILSILQDTLSALQIVKKDFDVSITLLVNNKNLVTGYKDDYEILEYPDVKSSWLKRLHFEYIESRKISEKLKPDLWISLHDMTPNVTSPVQVVYCHNPSPFYQLDVRRFFYDITFSLFCLFYKHLYRINIHKNAFIIVQQQWIREWFKKKYSIDTIVAYPLLPGKSSLLHSTAQTHTHLSKYTFFYPTFPRIFKNLETLCKAAKNLAESTTDFELIITISGIENLYAKKIVAAYKNVAQIKFIGLQPREEVEVLYKKVDSLIFPSKLETWGLPLSEFIKHDKPIIASDLPYAHETIGSYEKVNFFNPQNHEELAQLMQKAITGQQQFDTNNAVAPPAPFFTSWEQLLKFLLNYTIQKTGRI